MKSEYITPTTPEEATENIKKILASRPRCKAAIRYYCPRCNTYNLASRKHCGVRTVNENEITLSV